MPRIKVELSAEFITPCFGGTVSSNTSVSYPAELREPSIRGQIRWWMRACGMDRKAVDRIMGSTDSGQSLVRFRKKALVRNRMETEDWWTDPQYRACPKYLWFFVAPSTSNKKGESNRVGQKCITKGSDFKLELSCRPGQEAELKQIVAYTILWITFGSIGSRSTRAGGCMKYLGIKDIQGSDAICGAFQGLNEASLPELWSKISPQLGVELSTPPFRLLWDDRIRPTDSNAALDWFANKWKIVRAELRSSDKGFWGLPFKDKTPTQLEDKDGNTIKTERMTSHIHLRPLKTKDDGVFYPAALVFDQRMVLQGIDTQAGNAALDKYFSHSIKFNGGEQ
ncbi:type III-B CRISPR module RAMP protein Cmr1 [Marinifilum sp. JC120]|nr:type III-B CRISPR module RAMP protein Cmr1 [Marinifilum sp. JC120]